MTILLPPLGRDQIWREVREDLPFVVRFVLLDKAGTRFRTLGSGTIIGSIDDCWLIVATASHVIDDVEEIVAEEWLKAVRTPALHSGETRREMRERAANALRRRPCYALIGEPGRVQAIRVKCFESSRDTALRDTALVFLPLPRRRVVPIAPMYLGPLPKDETILVAGYGREAERALTLTFRDRLIVGPDSVLTVREGYLDGPVEASLVMPHPHLRHRIPIDAGMSGGPVLATQHSPHPSVADVFRKDQTLIALNNAAEEGSQVIHHERDRNSSATDAMALFLHDVALPDGCTWIHFKEAVRRGYVRSVGPEPQHVVVERAPDGTPIQCYIDPVSGYQNPG